MGTPYERIHVEGGVALLNSTHQLSPLQPPDKVLRKVLRQTNIIGESTARAEARRSDPGAHEPERVLVPLPLHPAWTGCPDTRSWHQFELRHEPESRLLHKRFEPPHDSWPDHSHRRSARQCLRAAQAHPCDRSRPRERVRIGGVSSTKSYRHLLAHWRCLRGR